MHTFTITTNMHLSCLSCFGTVSVLRLAGRSIIMSQIYDVQVGLYLCSPVDVPLCLRHLSYILLIHQFNTLIFYDLLVCIICETNAKHGMHLQRLYAGDIVTEPPNYAYTCILTQHH
jgi:hypothetical protein